MHRNHPFCCSAFTVEPAAFRAAVANHRQARREFLHTPMHDLRCDECGAKVEYTSQEIPEHSRILCLDHHPDYEYRDPDHILYFDKGVMLV